MPRDSALDENRQYRGHAFMVGRCLSLRQGSAPERRSERWTDVRLNPGCDLHSDQSVGSPPLRLTRHSRNREQRNRANRHNVPAAVTPSRAGPTRAEAASPPCPGTRRLLPRPRPGRSQRRQHHHPSVCAVRGLQLLSRRHPRQHERPGQVDGRSGGVVSQM